jgi:glutaredoxin
MKQSVKITLAVIGFFVLIGLSALLIKTQPKKVLYTSIGCPHCKNVEEFVNDNQINDYVDFIELEVSQNPQNSQMFNATAERCGIEPDKRGVPLFYDGEKCYLGDEDIISYFQDKKI